MSKIQPLDLTVPGIEQNELLLSWLTQENITLHEKLAIGKSELGGIGLIFDGREEVREKEDEEEDSDEEDLDVEEDEDIEILRIPSSIILDYKTLLSILEELKLRDLKQDDRPLTESALIINILTIGEPKTELEIIECYIIAFKILQEIAKNNEDEYYKTSPLRRFDMYLDILCGTYTLDPPEATASANPFMQKLINLSKTIKFEYELLIEQLLGLYDADLQKYLPFELFHHIKYAIKSRTLEIPHSDRFSNLSLKEENVEDVETTEDFYVNVTLVPILDFANHIHTNNSYFDIDLVTEDVILKLKHDRVEPRKFEITISYSPIESVEHFISHYGFIPALTEEPNHYQLFELKLANLDEHILHGEAIAKWLKILPQIQVIYGQDQVYFNFFNNNLPLLFIDDFKYNGSWPEQVVEEFKQLHDIDVDEEELVDMIKHQEEHYDVINGVGPVGVLFKGKPIQDLKEIIVEIASDESTYSFDDLIVNTIKYIIDYIKSLLPKLVSFPITNNFDTMTNEYNQKLSKVLQLIITRFETKDPRKLILPEDIARDEWEVEYRSTPRELILDE